MRPTLPTVCLLAGLFQAQARLLPGPELEAVLRRVSDQPAPQPVQATTHADDPLPMYWFLNNLTSPYWVDGHEVPDVPFDVGESYAGQMGLTDDVNEDRKLFFWFFPSESDDARENKDIIIWLNGGLTRQPGCSSMTGLMMENGPFRWLPGTYAPVRNPWSWHRLAHVLYVDQPIGTGYSTGPVTNVDEDDVARDFLMFWRRFVDTFALQGARVYLAGESYAGMYVPYIATHMLDQRDVPGEAAYFDVQGALLYDALIGSIRVQSEVPAVRFVRRTPVLHPFNESFSAHIEAEEERCGYREYMDRYLTYPPPAEPQPQGLPGPTDASCLTLQRRVVAAARSLNPCWSMYDVSSTCPPKWSVMGTFETSRALPAGVEAYFDRPDVQLALNVQMTTPWAECAALGGGTVFAGAWGMDMSLPSSVYALPSLLDRVGNVLIAHGSLDFILIDDGTLLAIQNMTWRGKRGFQTAPTEPLHVPAYGLLSTATSVAAEGEDQRHNQSQSQGQQRQVGFGPMDLADIAGTGQFGVAHKERGLTYVGVDLSGHMGPMSAPAAAMRMVEVLLGLTDNLQSKEPFVLERESRKRS